MKTIFETCVPRDEVLRGHLKEEIFPASLNEIYGGQAEDVYQDPDIFFSHTYVTDGSLEMIKDIQANLTVGKINVLPKPLH
jgi:predicted AAA+ superfamily ATPase